MKGIAPAVFLIVVLGAAVFLVLSEPGAHASPDVTITVDSTDDTNTHDFRITLREAILLATGDLDVGDLDLGECNQVSGAKWKSGWPAHCESYDPPGATSADTIVFDTDIFPPASPETIALIPSPPLPGLDTGDDTVDGSAAGVIVEGGGGGAGCIRIFSENNTVKGLVIHSCNWGVFLSDARNNTVGIGNVIYGNEIGVYIAGEGSSGNRVVGNYIGTDGGGSTDMGNDRGVMILNGSENSIGGSSEAERNVISGNHWHGVDIDFGVGNMVVGNYIGTNAAGDTAVPNGDNGVILSRQSYNNRIGGTAADDGNIIAFNDGDGVRVDGLLSDPTGNGIRGNSIHSNGGKGIENVDGGNTELIPPTIAGFGSVSGTACPNCAVDVYSDQEDEGRVYEGSTTADGAGNWTFPDTPDGPNVTATATDASGNTSEFSDPVAVPEATPAATATPTATPTPPDAATRTVVWSPGWHNETWSGVSIPEEAFACAAGNYASAYRLVGGGWERYFPDRPDLSNMTDLEQYDSFLILITDDVTCEMPVVDPPGTERTLEWGVGWQNDGWTGPDGTAPEDAFACADGSYAAAYHFTDAGLERYFPDRPDISNMGPVNKYDAFLILVTAPVSCTMPIAP